MSQSTFAHCLTEWQMLILFFKRTTIHTNTNWDISFSQIVCNIFHFALVAYISGIYSNLTCPTIARTYCQSIIKMYICNNRNVHCLNNFFECNSTFLVRHRKPNNITTIFFQLQYLLNTAIYICCFCIAH